MAVEAYMVVVAVTDHGGPCRVGMLETLSDAIDTLRGVAVLGILVMNIYAFAMPLIAYQNPLAMGGTEPHNLGTWFVTHIFVDQKFLTLFAMRVFPAFPHSVVNYSAGMLEARLSHFILSAILGISIKSYVYAQVIYSASTSLSLNVLLDVWIVGPLVLLSAASATVVFINYRLSTRRGSGSKRP